MKVGAIGHVPFVGKDHCSEKKSIIMCVNVLLLSSSHDHVLQQKKCPFAVI